VGVSIDGMTSVGWESMGMTSVGVGCPSVGIRLRVCEPAARLAFVFVWLLLFLPCAAHSASPHLVGVGP
jgi:hypothetical protein